MFISGSNIRGEADIKEIMATGKRSQVLITGWFVNLHLYYSHRLLAEFLEKDLVLEVLADTG